MLFILSIFSLCSYDISKILEDSYHNSAIFSRFTYHITAGVLVSAIQEFFRFRNMMPRFLTASLIALIPKVSTATDISDYRPISLCNIVYKVISKVISNRLVTILPNIISLEQIANFLPEPYGLNLSKLS